jgi:hypothetical protein
MTWVAVLEEGGAGGDAQDGHGAQEEDDAHRGAVDEGHGVGEHFDVSGLVLRCSICVGEALGFDVIIDTPASFLDHVNIE